MGSEDNCVIESESERKFYHMSSDSLENMVNSEYFALLHEKTQEGNIDEALDCLESLLNEVCIRKSKKKRNPKSNREWWDNEMSELKSRKLRSLRLLRKVPSEQNLLEYKKCKRLYKSKIRQKMGITQTC